MKHKVGVVLGGLHDDNVTTLVKQLLWKDYNKSVTLKISRDQDDCHIFVEIKEIES